MIIAVCDDNNDFLRQIEHLLIQARQEEDTIFTFSNGAALLAQVGQGPYPYDVTFLDLQMPGISGLEVARHIREIAPLADIVILTNYDEYALEAYQVRPYDYLLKPATEKQLANISNQIRGKQLQQASLTFLAQHKYITLPINSISHVESYRDLKLLHSGAQTYHLYTSFNQVCRELEPQGFMRIHRSYLVNLAYVREINKKLRELRLIGGESLPVSRQHMAAVSKAFLCRRARLL